MNHEESRLQQQCVAWFRAQYPQYAMLLTHPINEGYRNTGKIGGIHKAEGTVAGVSDLLFFMPSKYFMENHAGMYFFRIYHGLGIEMKTAKGKQQQSQKDFQKMIEAAGYKYEVIRSLDDFRKLIDEYIANAESWIRDAVVATHNEITKAAEEREKEKFLKFIGKK